MTNKENYTKTGAGLCSQWYFHGRIYTIHGPGNIKKSRTLSFSVFSLDLSYSTFELQRRLRDREKDMEESLLAKGIKEEKRKPETPSLTWVTFTGELKRLGFLAGPMVVVTLSQYLLQVISLMMVGHLGELALSSAAIAISLSAVTGFSLLVSLCYLLSF